MNTLSCVLLPMTGTRLLLPAVSIAEILDVTNTLQPVTGYEGVVGRIQWRGQSLPVLSWEMVNREKVRIPEGGRGRILILNTIGKHRDQLPFMALTSQGAPQEVEVRPSQLHSAIEQLGGPADRMTVTLDDEPAIIPDLTYLEVLALNAVRS